MKAGKVIDFYHNSPYFGYSITKNNLILDNKINLDQVILLAGIPVIDQAQDPVIETFNNIKKSKSKSSTEAAKLTKLNLKINLAITRPLRKILRISADSSLIRQKVPILYKMM